MRVMQLNSKTSMLMVFGAPCGKCVFNSNHDACDLIVQLILFIVDSGCTKHMTGNLSLLCNFVEKYLGTIHFGNDQFAPILGYGGFGSRNITIQQGFTSVKDLQGNDLLTGNRGTDLYTISLQETTSSTPICLMAKASPTQAWLWHRRTTISTLGIHQLDFNERMLYWFTLTESKGYRVYNKRTRLVVESINLIFDEIKEMSETSVANNTSDLIPQQQKASDYDYLTLAPYTKLFLL
ncbi:hypothetical protein Tco_1285034 [Tanacetum coccineum]